MAKDYFRYNMCLYFSESVIGPVLVRFNTTLASIDILGTHRVPIRSESDPDRKPSVTKKKPFESRGTA